MLTQIDHIGIAVKNLDTAIPLYEKLLGCVCYKKETVPTEGVTTAFFKCGETKIELLAATGSDSAIARFIEKRGEGIHHIAFRTDNINSEMLRIIKEGFKLIHSEPMEGADNMMINFIHPKSAGGVLV